LFGFHFGRGGFRGNVRRLGGGAEAVRCHHGFHRFRLRGVLPIVAAQLDGHVFVDGAGVRLFLADAELGEQVENLVSLDLQLTRQLVDANLLHRKEIC
jgi:hypothetical protein